MDLAILLILPVVGGFIFSTKFHYSRYQALREDGRKIYFRAIFYSVFFLIAAILINMYAISSFETYRLLVVMLNNEYSDLFSSITNKAPKEAFLISIIAFFIGSTLWLLLNPLVKWLDIALRSFHDIWLAIRNSISIDHQIIKRRYQLPHYYWISIADDDFERIIAIAATRPMPIMATMDNNKVYVGYVVNSIDPCVERKAVTIAPQISGYRDSKTGKVYFTTEYHLVYEEMINSQESFKHLHKDDFMVVIPMDKISSISLFDPVAYTTFQSFDG